MKAHALVPALALAAALLAPPLAEAGSRHRSDRGHRPPAHGYYGHRPSHRPSYGYHGYRYRTPRPYYRTYRYYSAPYGYYDDGYGYGYGLRLRRVRLRTATATATTRRRPRATARPARASHRVLVRVLSLTLAARSSRACGGR